MIKQIVMGGIIVVMGICKEATAYDGDYLTLPMAKLSRKVFVSFELFNQFLTAGVKFDFLQFKWGTCYKKEHPLIDTSSPNNFFDVGCNIGNFAMGIFWGARCEGWSVDIPGTFGFYLIYDYFFNKETVLGVGTRLGLLGPDYKEGFMLVGLPCIGIKKKIKNLYTVGEINYFGVLNCKIGVEYYLRKVGVGIELFSNFFSNFIIEPKGRKKPLSPGLRELFKKMKGGFVINYGF